MGVEALYTTIETKEVNILGVPVKIKTISGYEYLRITDSARKGTDIDRAVYAKELINACVVSPQLNIGKLSTTAILLLVSKIEEALGVAEAVQKNLSEAQIPGLKST